MQLSEFDYVLPQDLIAQLPSAERSDSRLLVVDGEHLVDARFREFQNYLAAGDLLIFNDTKVINARLFGRKASGGRIEILVERIVGERQAWCHVKASHAPKPGDALSIGDTGATMLGREGGLFLLEFSTRLEQVLDRYGTVPLPPYISRAAEDVDAERYQTVYARHAGAVAAPTAGLHFDADTLAALDEKGVQRAYITLHVGAGTFQPIRVDDIHAHTMHTERYDIPQETVDRIAAARAAGKRVVAIGTTSLRALEAAAAGGEIRTGPQETALFITPGYRFRVVDALFTNFHLPKSTLLILVSAFAGRANIARAYAWAIEQRYRFFSYGDAMFIAQRHVDEI